MGSMQMLIGHGEPAHKVGGGRGTCRPPRVCGIAVNDLHQTGLVYRRPLYAGHIITRVSVSVQLRRCPTYAPGACVTVVCALLTRIASACPAAAVSVVSVEGAGRDRCEEYGIGATVGDVRVSTGRAGSTR